MHISFREWIFECDVEATRTACDSIASGGAEECGCGYCLNFIEARRQVYPAELLDLLARLGIDYRKEVEVYQMTRSASGLHLYGGWFHFIGRILKRPVAPEKLNEQFSVDFLTGNSLAAAAFADRALVQIEFTTEIPWLLEEEQDPDTL
ncbi:MAG TPA: hypothetical protein VEZ40_17850 [Pyrinomonadaceae bacterium]|nr:hypothetical protein [Pyrinomonadaceae bacterium]